MPYDTNQLYIKNEQITLRDFYLKFLQTEGDWVTVDHVQNFIFEIPIWPNLSKL